MSAIRIGPYRSLWLCCAASLMVTLVVAEAAVAQSGAGRHATTRTGSVLAPATVAPSPAGAKQRVAVQPAVGHAAPAATATPPAAQQAVFDTAAMSDGDVYQASCNCGACGDCGDACGTACGDLIDQPLPPLCGQVCVPRVAGPWFRAEYLGWRIDPLNTPALVTTTSPTPTIDQAGVIGVDGTEVLFGGGGVIGSSRAGVRVSGGFLLNPAAGLGIEASYFGFGDGDVGFAPDSDAFAVLARPFENVEAGSTGEDSEIVAFPNQITGSVAVRADSSLDGVEVLLDRRLFDNGCARMAFLVGWKSVRLEESLVIDDFRTVVDSNTELPLAIGSTLAETDEFITDSQFHGGVIGFSGTRRHGRITWEGALKLGLGSTNSRATLRGQTTATVPLPGGGADVTTTGVGLLTQGTNIGTFEQSDFAVVPELRLGLTYCLTPRLNATVGYNLLYVSRVARVGDQIDRELNLTQLDVGGLVGDAAPEFEWTITDLLAQGVNVGLEWRY